MSIESLSISKPFFELKFIQDENINMTAPLMGKRFIESMETAFDNWKPVDNFRLEEVA